jgi:hypothetical protein
MKKIFYIFLIINAYSFMHPMNMEVDTSITLPNNLKEAIESEDIQAITNITRDNPALKHAKYSDHTPATQATFNEKGQALRCLVNLGYCLNSRDHCNWTPLMCSAYCADLSSVQLLVIHGADIGAKLRDGSTIIDLLHQRFLPLPGKTTSEYQPISSFLSAPFRQEILLTKATLNVAHKRSYQLLTPDLSTLCVDYAYGQQARTLAYDAELKKSLENAPKSSDNSSTKKHKRDEVALSKDSKDASNKKQKTEKF